MPGYYLSQLKKFFPRVNNIKRFSLVTVLFITVFLSSCSGYTERLSVNNKPVVDFSVERKVQCEFNSGISDLSVIQQENGINIVYLTENNETSDRFETYISNGICNVKFKDSEYERSMSYFGNEFLPQIISTFILQTDFEFCECEYNSELYEYVFSSNVYGKFVELHLTKNINSDDFIYSMKII